MDVSRMNPWIGSTDSDTERLVEEIPLERPHYQVLHPREERSLFDYFLIAVSCLFVICTFPLSLFACIKVVKEYQRAVIYRLGRVTGHRARGPGLFFVLPCTDVYYCVDVRVKSFDLKPQKILSKDSVTVRVEAVVYYRITDAAHAVSNVLDHYESTELLAASTLRKTLGTKNLSEILLNIEEINHVVQSCLDEATMPWGVKVERVEIKDVLLPKDMRRSFASEAEATREAKARVIVAEGEHRASTVLKEAADIMAGSSGAFKLCLLHTLQSIAAEKDSKIILKLPGINNEERNKSEHASTDQLNIRL